MRKKFLSTPSARRATTDVYALIQSRLISIHALREEGDSLPKAVVKDREEFLSTPSARRATGWTKPQSNQSQISIHALREEGDNRCPCSSYPLQISIHALREEGDFSAPLTSLRTSEFLSTPSARRATAAYTDNIAMFFISIHALREEGDYPQKYQH